MEAPLLLGKFAAMLRILILPFLGIATVAILASATLFAEEKKTGDADIFFQSLQPEGEVSEDSDRCPGETAADRDESSEEEFPLETTPGKEITLPEEAPKILPDGIEAAPIVEGIPKPSQKKDLTYAQIELREKIRDTLAWYYNHPQKVTDRSPWGIMHAMIPFGVDSYILDARGERQNTIGYLCYNYPCKGQRLFHLDSNRQIAAHIGPGLQGHQGQFLAMLAQSKVDPKYPMRVEGRELHVADLIEYEKRSCEAGTELTFKLIALTHYLKHDEKWKNTKGEEWDIPRLIREELKQSVVGAACGGTHRMTGFSYAVRRHEIKKLPFDGQWLRASKFIDSYHDYASTLQNRDGSFSTKWFAGREERPDLPRRLQTSGHILEWLVYSLPEEDLENKRLVQGVEYITNLLAEGKKTNWEIGPLGHALHALALYDERVFGGKPGKREVELANRPRQGSR